MAEAVERIEGKAAIEAHEKRVAEARRLIDAGSVSRLIEEWQQRLRLQDWVIHWQVTRSVDQGSSSEHAFASIRANPMMKRAEIVWK